MARKARGLARKARIEAARKVGIQHTKLPHQPRVHIERLGESKVLRDKAPPLFGGHQLARQRIAKKVGVEEELLFAESEVVDRSQQRTVIENPATKPESKLS